MTIESAFGSRMVAVESASDRGRSLRIASAISKLAGSPSARASASGRNNCDLLVGQLGEALPKRIAERVPDAVWAERRVQGHRCTDGAKEALLGVKSIGQQEYLPASITKSAPGRAGLRFGDAVNTSMRHARHYRSGATPVACPSVQLCTLRGGAVSRRSAQAERRFRKVMSDEAVEGPELQCQEGAPASTVATRARP